jgi:hypothetical protein
MAARARAEAEGVAAAQATTAEESRKAQEQARELVEKAQSKRRGLSQPPVIDAVESVAEGTIGGLVATLAAVIIEPADARTPQLPGILLPQRPASSSAATRSVAALGVEIGAE